MEIEINACDLKSVLKKFKAMDYKHTDTPAQKSLFITAKNDNTALFKICNGNDNGCFRIIQMEVTLSVTIIEPGTVLIPNELLPVIKSIEESKIIITDKKIIYGENSIDYISPNYDFIEINLASSACWKKLFEIPENELYKLIKNTAYGIANDEIRPILTGLNFQRNRVCSLNGYRLAVCSTDKFNIDSSITLPGNLIKLLLKVINKRSENRVQVYTDNEAESIKIVIQDLIITSKLLEAEYIKYKSIIPEEYNLKIRIDPKQLYGKMKSMFRMTLSAQEIVTFTINRDKLTIEKQNKAATIQESLPIKVLKKEIKLPLKIASNAAYWKEPLKKYDEFTIEFSSSISPMVLKDDTDLDLILPVRIRN